MIIKQGNISPEFSIVVDVGEQNMDQFFFNSQDSLALIEPSELFKASIEPDVMKQMMENTVNSESEEFINENRNIALISNGVKLIHEVIDDVNDDVSPPTGIIPSQEDYSGNYGFDLHITGGGHNRGSYVYSPLLRQVFIGMNNVLLMEFKTTELLDPGFYIRALLIYSCDDFVCQAVVRCVSHALEDDPMQEAHARGQESICRCTSFKNVGHVMRCSLSEAEYCYDSTSERHSVRVPVKRLQAGTDFIQIPYTFSCKTSCPRGMQRKPVQIVFTLENEKGDVFGRKVLPIKICSCPKRDKDRQERDFKKDQNCTPSSSKRLATAPPNVNEAPQPPVKSIKLEESNFEDSQNEEEKQKHRKQLTNTHSTLMDHEQCQRLFARINSLENTLSRLENEWNEKFDRLENKWTEKLDRIEGLLNHIVQRLP